MRSSATVLAVMLTLIVTAHSAGAAAVHFFDCKECHLSSLSLDELGAGNLCLKCHDTVTGVATDFNDGRLAVLPTGTFVSGDASDAMGNNPSAVLETSHNWAAPQDVLPAAGAVAPLDDAFYSLYQTSHGKVTCSRCHNPHDTDANPQLLVLGHDSSNDMCLDCHSPWDQPDNLGFMTHPLVEDYDAILNDTGLGGKNETGKYRPLTNTAPEGDIQLVDGGVSCTSCHDVHWVDSDSSSPDGKDSANNGDLNMGDGKLLRSDGRSLINAQVSSNLCQTCHTYNLHGSASLGCLECHSGHSYNNDNINYYVLRYEIPDVDMPVAGVGQPTTNGTATNLDYSTENALWLSDTDGNGDGIDDGYCQQCHQSLAGNHNGFTTGNADDCALCHAHDNDSFAPACDSCHGSPPIVNTLGGPDGLADTPVTTGSMTVGAHDEHVNNQGINDCDTCHTGWRVAGEMPKSDNSGDINVGFLDGSGAADAGAGYGGQIGVTYNTVDGDGTLRCNNLYCHGSTIGQIQIPVWNNPNTGDCGDCHGASAASPPVAPASGRSHGTHAAATGRNLDCNACHGSGYDQGAAAPAGHADADVLYNVATLDSSYRDSKFPATPVSYAGSSGAASTGARAPSAVYAGCTNVWCHWGTTTPLWNTDLTTVNGGYKCTICHNDGTVLPGNGTLDNAHPGSGQHDEHAGASDDFVDCDSCHGNGAINGTHAGHINDLVDVANELAGGIYDDGGDRNNTANDTCADACHESASWDSGGSIFWTDGVTDACTDCHSDEWNAKAGPTIVDDPYLTASGDHLKINTADSLPNSAAGWKVRCNGCHDKHNGTIPIPIPTTFTNLGIKYAGANHGAIKLKPNNGSTSEAQTCWNCHDQNNDGTLSDPEDIAEWKGQAYNGYSVTGSKAWTTAVFNAPGVTIPDRETVAIHSVNPDHQSSSVADNVDWTTGNEGMIKAGKTLEADSAIRCSWCHDVHELALAVGDSKTGKPYLRGSWMDNPYPLERPPESGDIFPGNNWGQSEDLPRLFTTSTGSGNVGGYFIDQNSDWPTWDDDTDRFATVDETAGLCLLCHGGMTDSMNYYNNDFELWVGSNGHSNSTLGGSGSNASNIFDALRGEDANHPFYMASQGAFTGFESQWGDQERDRWTDENRDAKEFLPFGRDFSFQPADNGYAPQRNTGWYGEYNLSTGGYTSSREPGDNVRPPQYSTWYGNSDVNGLGAGVGSDGSVGRAGEPVRAHNFSCSKCHTPHASGLPALLITNCLDNQLPGNHASGWSATGYDDRDRPITVGPKATNRWAMQVQNSCHRNDSWDTGWNRLAPDQ